MEALNKVLKSGVSKYKLSKFMNVNWRTIHNWSNGKSKPNEKNQIKLDEALTHFYKEV